MLPQICWSSSLINFYTLSLWQPVEIHLICRTGVVCSWITNISFKWFRFWVVDGKVRVSKPQHYQAVPLSKTPDPLCSIIAYLQSVKKIILINILISSSLFRVLSVDGIIETVKRRRYYEKPCRQRQRENYENCKRLYNMEMARKLSFVSRTNRQDPWLGCWSAPTRDGHLYYVYKGLHTLLSSR